MRTPFSFLSRFGKKTGADGRKTTLITGGSNGIGRSIAQRLADTDWNVVVLDPAEPAEAFGGRIVHVLGDVASEEDVQQAVDESVDRFGGLDALINNAGIGITKPIEKLSLEEWNRVLSVNLTGTFLCAKHATPLLRKNKGAILNIASTRARQSEANTEAYSASKGGITALTHALAISLGPDIRVNCISPGWIETDPQAVHSETDELQHPCGRVGTPDDIASMAVYLLSDQAGFITGQNFVVDGGMTRKMIYID